MRKLILLISILVLTEYVTGDVTDVRAEDTLRENLMRDYDKNARPSYKTVINISSISILNFDMHESDHSINLHTFFSYSWMEPRLKYNAEENIGISSLGMDPDTLWKPDLSVYNAAAARKTRIESMLPLLLYPSGKILYVPAFHFHFSCVMDLTYWPHDTHNCSMKLGSWSHNGNLLDLALDDFKIVMLIPSTAMADGSRNLSRSEWEIKDTTAAREVKYYSCCEEPYVDVFITLLVTRNAPAYTWTVKMPAACLSILTLVMFLLPPGAGEKIIFGGLCLVLDLLYINYTSFAINHAPSHTPLIVQLVCQQVVLMMVSVIVSAIVVRMARDPHSSGLPHMIKGPITGLSYILCLGNYANLASGSYSTFSRTIKSDEVELGDECNGDIRKREQNNSNEWLILAAVIDRLFFILYSAICIISLIRFSSVL
uniref:Nicotinic acetylcholine receptor subunit alpha 11 n=1 Tax=Pandalus japonicus TaxID=666362 RepID=R4JS65_PANJP|nr:nicotinic acetylcholine receptor subunit alpha 11 [Pandalus japonicus]